MKTLTRLVLPFLIAVPAAHAADPSETIEVVDSKPAKERPDRPGMSLKVPDFSLQSKVFDFPTGLRFIMQSDQSHPYVSVFMVVDHGAGDDPDGKAGTAHFVEHTWFRSVHGDLPPIMTLIQDLGVQFNATTRPDTTDFRTVASSEYLPILMRLESLRLTEPYIGMTEDQVDTEREVVRNEWRRRNEQGGNLLFDYTLKSVFPEGHPYHDRETNESLDNIDLATLEGYFDDHYKPENATIIVIGDFPESEMRSLIFSNFDLKLLHPDLTEEHLFTYAKPGIENPDESNPDHWLTDAFDPANPEEPFPFPDVQKHPRPPRVTAETAPLPPAPGKDVLTYEAAIDNRTVLVAWAVPGGFRGNDFNMSVLANTAGGRIAGELRRLNYLDTDDNKKGLKDPSCGYQAMKEHSLILCGIEVTDKKRWKDSTRVADLMLDQLAEIWNPELVQLNQKFFSRAKMEGIAGVLRSVDTVAQHFGGRAEDIGFHAHQTSSVTYHTDAMKSIMAIDFGQVSDLGYQFLKRDRAAIVQIDPIPQSEVDTSAETSSYAGASEGDAALQSSDKLESITKEEIASAYIKPDMTDLVDKKLPNGMRIVILPHGESPLVEATLVLGGGVDTDPPGLYGFSRIFSGDAWETNDELQIAAERTYDRSRNHHTTGVRAPAGNLDGALWFLREEMETKYADLNYRTNFARREKRDFLGGLHGAGYHLQDLSQHHLYPDAPHYWGTSWDEVQNYGTWTSSDVRSYLERTYQPANATLVIVGNVDPDESLRQAVEYFAGWQPAKDVEVGPVQNLPTPAIEEGSKVYVFDDPKRTQTQVSYECRLNYNGVEDIQAISVLSNVIFDRTFSQLRVKEGLAYSPGGASFASPDGSAVLSFSSLAVNVGVGRTLEFFKDMTAKVENGEIDDNMLTIYKLRRARNLGIAAQSTNQMTSKLAYTLRWDQPWTFMTDAGDHIAEVDAAQIQRMTKGCNDRAIATLRGPAEVITPQLDERGIAYEVVDWKARGDELHEQLDPKGFKKYKKAEAKAEKKKKKEEEKEGDASASSDE